MTAVGDQGGGSASLPLMGGMRFGALFGEMGSGRLLKMARDVTWNATSQLVSDVGTGFVGAVKGAASGTMNAATKVATAFAEATNFAASPEVGPLTERDVKEVRLREGAHPPTEKDIQREADLFATHMAHVVGMRMLDGYFGIEKSEAFYLELGGGRDSYFKHLDRSDLIFLSRWVAKLAYRLFEWFGQGAIKGATLSLFETLGGQVEAFDKGKFNESMEQRRKHTNVLLEKWIGLMKGVADHSEKTERVIDSIDREINAPDEAFYREITNRIVDDLYQELSIGRFCFDRLSSVGSGSEGRLLVALSLFVRVLLFPVALAARVLFLAPDYLLAYYVTSRVRQTLTDGRILENLVEKLSEGAADNKALAIPLFTVLNQALEEMFLDLKEHPEGNEELDRLKGLLSPEFHQLVDESMDLADESLSLFSCETVRELEAFIQKGPGIAARLQGLIKAEKASGMENMDLILYSRLQDGKYLKAKLYSLIQGLNGAFAAPQQAEEEQKAELEKVQGRTLELLNAVVAKSIQNAVSAKLKAAGVTIERLDNKIFEITVTEVGKMIAMHTSPQFLKLAEKEALREFFGVSKPA
ncbi:MAG: hypothetical protein K940chlam2_01276 [Chlamydiae bacterium]|nr:hypothetical protein [Chlamydiota bacterium]